MNKKIIIAIIFSIAFFGSLYFISGFIGGESNTAAGLLSRGGLLSPSFISRSGSNTFVRNTSDSFGIGTSTPKSILHFEVAPTGDGTIATSTLTGGQQGATTSRTSIELKDEAGNSVCAYVVGTSWVIESATCN